MTRRILVLLVGLLVLAGCGGGSDPAVVAGPTPSPMVSPVEESSSAAPLMETPELFIRRWLSLEVEMENSGDSSAYRAATPACKPCMELADQVDGYYDAGGFIRFGGQSVERIKELESDGPRSVFEVRVDPEPTEYAIAAAAPTEKLVGEQLTFKVTLEPAGDAWTLIGYTQLAS